MNLIGRALPLVHKATPDEGMLDLPGVAGKWTDSRDIPQPPKSSFRTWWKDNRDD